MVRARYFRLLAAFLLACVAATQAPLAQQASFEERWRSGLIAVPPGLLDAPEEACGTGFEHLRLLGLAFPTALESGDSLMADHQPRIITADYIGDLTITVHMVGDHSSIQFERLGRLTTTETWDRTSTRTVDGTLVSVFEKTYSGSELADHLGGYSWGFDDGGLQWGNVISPGTGTKTLIRLRIGSTNLPTAAFTPATQTIKLADDVQYAGSVVNLRIPGFGDSRVAGGDDFDLEGAARKFYEYFPDAFDSIAFIPQSLPLVSYGAFHRVVKNEVTGIGDRLRDDSANYGSAGTLLAVEVYSQHSFSRHSTSVHEMIHQWANFLDMPKLAGVEAKGHQPVAHTALTPGTTLVGAVVEGDRTVSRVAETLTGSDFEITSSLYPILFHPQEMYALGKISIDELGTQLISDNQGQFNPDGAASPPVGTKLTEGLVEVTTGAILGQHGARGGPSPSEWHRATVVVSRDELLSDVEMNYWSFFAQRMSDPNNTGVPSFDGYVSFDRATSNTVDLKSEVAPKSLAGLALGDPLVEVTVLGRIRHELWHLLGGRPVHG